jgi:hypothetical protein
MRRTRYLLATAALAALVGCGDDQATDVDEVQKALARDVQEQTGTRSVQVVCPDDVSEGDLCDVTAEGGVKAQVRVVRLEGDDVEGEVVQP